jgi:DNA-binding IclR family transcriptional regulator
MPVAKRDDSDYEIEALSKGLAVLEALEDGPVKRARIETRTGFSRDLTMRTLRTLRLRGYAVQNDRGEWSLGPRVLQLSNDFHKLCLTALAKDSGVRAFGNSEADSPS